MTKSAIPAREFRALRHMSRGLTVRAIAAKLRTSESSARTLLRRAAKNLKARNALHAVAVAIRRRLI